MTVECVADLVEYAGISHAGVYRVAARDDTGAYRCVDAGKSCSATRGRSMNWLTIVRWRGCGFGPACLATFGNGLRTTRGYDANSGCRTHQVENERTANEYIRADRAIARALFRTCDPGAIEPVASTSKIHEDT